MKNHPLRFASLLLLLPLCGLAGTATIKIDVNHVIAAVDPRIYGIFMEPIGIHRPEMKFHTLYGPLYDPRSPLADKNGFRTDIQSIAGTFAGSATVTQIASEDVTNQPYTYEARDTYLPKTEQVPANGSTIHYVFPAHSFTQIVVGVNRE